MMNRLSRVLAVILLSGLAMSGHPAASAAPGTGRAPSSLNALLSSNRGRVLILLLGRDGCPGTAKATAALDKYVPTKPKQVSVVRLDVPLPNERLRPTAKWNHAFPRFVDTGRRIADRLEFFYFPTLYVFDGQGGKRYVGALDEGRMDAMVREIVAEKPGAVRKVYTTPMPAVGRRAPAFSGTTLSGVAASQTSLMGKHGLLVIFARTSCQFSAADMPQFKDIADRFRGKGVNTVIVNQQEALDTIKPIYARKCAGVEVIWDHDGDICKSYGVDAVPYFFLVTDAGQIVSRRSFTHTAGLNSINRMLGLKTEGSLFKPTEGG